MSTTIFGRMEGCENAILFVLAFRMGNGKNGRSSLGSREFAGEWARRLAGLKTANYVPLA
jgi:hypothetical protein